MDILELGKMREKIRQFVKERDWEQFQTAKNITMALTIEASELMEIFQWMKDEESSQIIGDEKKMEKIKEEISDVLYWIIRLSDVLKIDLNVAFWEKLEKNKGKYPSEVCKGKATKYTEL